MSRTSRKPAGTRFQRVLHAVFAQGLPLETETVRFVIVSLGDIILTWLLLTRGDHTESNPVARWFLFHWGFRGLIYFKFAMVGFVCLITQWIARHQVETARRVLNLAAVVVSLVLVYSLVLLLRAEGISLRL